MEEIHTQVGSAWESTPYLLLIQGLDNTGFDPFFMVFDIGFFFSVGKSGWKKLRGHLVYL